MNSFRSVKYIFMPAKMNAYFETTLPSKYVELLFYYIGVVPVNITMPEWNHLLGMSGIGLLPLLTSLFLHGGWFHIFSNVWSLWIFGDNVEDKMGSGRFLMFYLLCGLISSIVHILMNPLSTLPAVGASGAIAGVMGAYLVLFPRARIILLFPVLFLPFFFEVPAFVFLLVWFYSQFFCGTLSLAAGHVGGVAWWTHIGGFIGGAILFPLFLKPRGLRRPI